MSVEPIDGKYSCSLEVFLGDVKVWNSGHYSPFFTSERCVLELTKQGDLQLKGEKERVGWRTGTSGQGVERWFFRWFCGRGEVEMRELYGVSSVLRAAPTKLNISKVACAKFCLQNCKCVAALYSSEELRECHLYGVVMGVKQVERGTRWSYMVKVQKGSYVGHENSGLKKWVLAMVGLIDSLVILLVFGGFAYYLIRKRRKNTATTADNTT
ncbi:hypothetical protein GH714_018938 [Hevea brasiliensis]|uniref:Apple domain-containing protein n=1 Tax=Hevea brasiliensis TaxID=3981 RepID=A0A6A6M1K4_HEVBR|nr:hypothetical protein GH714_018938 [Hevea brasiliensis]